MRGPLFKSHQDTPLVEQWSPKFHRSVQFHDPQQNETERPGDPFRLYGGVWNRLGGAYRGRRSSNPELGAIPSSIGEGHFKEASAIPGAIGGRTPESSGSRRKRAPVHGDCRG